jgi:hypothetical protein
VDLTKWSTERKAAVMMGPASMIKCASDRVVTYCQHIAVFQIS